MDEDGLYESHVEWSSLKVDLSTLRVDAEKARSYSSKLAGTRSMRLGNAADCSGREQNAQPTLKLGRAVIDLQGTPFKIANAVPSCDCLTKANCACSQWSLNGYNSAMSLKCTQNGQRCVASCGGEAGACFLTTGYLQLELMPGYTKDALRQSCPTTTSSATATTTTVTTSTSSSSSTTTTSSTNTTTTTTTTMPLKECVCRSEWSYEGGTYSGCPAVPIPTDDANYTWCYTTEKCFGSEESKHADTAWEYKDWVKCGASAPSATIAPGSGVVSATTAATIAQPGNVSASDASPGTNNNNSSKNATAFSTAGVLNAAPQKSSSAGVAVGVTLAVLLVGVAIAVVIVRQKHHRQDDAQNGLQQNQHRVDNPAFDANPRVAVQLVPNSMYRPATGDGSNPNLNSNTATATADSSSSKPYAMAGGYAGVFTDDAHESVSTPLSTPSAPSAVVYAVPVEDFDSSNYGDAEGSGSGVEKGTVVYVASADTGGGGAGTRGGGEVSTYSVPVRSGVGSAGPAEYDLAAGGNSTNHYDMQAPRVRAPAAAVLHSTSGPGGVADGHNHYDMQAPRVRTPAARTVPRPVLHSPGSAGGYRSNSSVLLPSMLALMKRTSDFRRKARKIKDRCGVWMNANCARDQRAHVPWPNARIWGQC